MIKVIKMFNLIIEGGLSTLLVRLTKSVNRPNIGELSLARKSKFAMFGNLGNLYQ
jgi:hypothetical protein